MHQLRREDLVEILTEPKNALTRQYQRFFGYDSIELEFREDALWEIADKALERETGARGLRSIIEHALLDVMFELPSRTDVNKCVITKETIEKNLRPTLLTEGGRSDRQNLMLDWRYTPTLTDTIEIDAYATRYQLRLWSNFTFFAFSGLRFVQYPSGGIEDTFDQPVRPNAKPASNTANRCVGREPSRPLLAA